MSVVARIISRQGGGTLLRLRGEHHRQGIGSKIPRICTKLDCGCAYLATGEVRVGEYVFCHWHRRP